MKPETMHDWRELYVQFCPTCDCDTLTLNSGLCGWCDTRLREPFGSHELPDAFGGSGDGFVAPAPDGACRHCRVVLPESVAAGLEDLRDPGEARSAFPDSPALPKAPAVP